MTSRRAYEGTIPSLTPGVRIGGEFELKPDGSAEFIAQRLQRFDELKKAKAELPSGVGASITILLPSGEKVEGTANVTKPEDLTKDKHHILAKLRFTEDSSAVPGREEIIDNISDDEGSVLIDPEDEVEQENKKKEFLWDMFRPIPASCSIEFYEATDKEAQSTFFHSSGHLLGLVVEHVYGAKVTIGPALENGFYYDFYVGDKITISNEDYKKLQAVAKKFTASSYPFERLDISKDEALELFQDNPFKMALINAKVTDGSSTSVYRCGPFVDLCMGPHVPNLNVIKAYAIEKHSAAYWLGHAKGDSLQRVYGIAFPNSEMMAEHVRIVQEAKKRDHRVLGTKLNLFFFDNYTPGSAFWTPSGTRMYNKLIDLMRQEYRFRGFVEVHTPNLLSSDIFKVSGHWQNYKDSMFCMKVEEKDWALKPMNCPGHCMIFKNQNPSYKNLPIRMADFGVLHRNELSGALSGLTRVRRFQQDDAHIFCRLDQVREEVHKAIEFFRFIYDLLGYRIEVVLATRPKKAMGAIELWNDAENQLKVALEASGMPWKINKGDGAFYGPKIDVRLYDAMGRGHQCGTVQLDFQLPLRFDLQYRTASLDEAGTKDEKKPVDETGENGQEDVPKTRAEGSLETEVKTGFARPVMIHRAILGSIERHAAVLLEHTAGRLPFWVSPRQAIVCSVTENHAGYAKYVEKVLRDRGFDAAADISNNTLPKKVREAAVLQWNFVLVVGDNEIEHQTVTVRVREDPDNQQEMTLPALVEMFDELRDVAHHRPGAIEPYKG